MTSRGSKSGMVCPHCEAYARVRSSRTLSPLYRERKYQCTNPDCGHTFVVGLEVMRTLSPSGTPNPNVHIPYSPRTLPDSQLALDIPLPERNDT